MKLAIGFEFEFECPHPTPMLLMVSVHSSRTADLITPDLILAEPDVPITGFQDGFGNWCWRLVAPAGRMRLSNHALLHDSGQADPVACEARQMPVEALPNDVLQFLRGSRYCETDSLSDVAWSLFGNTSHESGWRRVQRICDYVHARIEFGYAHARPTKSATEVHAERAGVCRDYAHLAIAFCRAMNIPARYCSGYLGDIGIPPPYGEMDFAGWFEAYLDGSWHTFDPRNNIPRIGRVLIARGRDAGDVPISFAFGTAQLTGFRVFTDEVDALQPAEAGCSALQSVASAEPNPASPAAHQAHHQRDDEENDEDEEQHPRDVDRAGGNAGESEQPGDQCDNQENYGVVEHGRNLPGDP